jgi:hypothetical protein
MTREEIIKERIVELKRMDNNVKDWDNEILWCTWIALGVPDEATEEDFEDIASDDECYEDIVGVYERLLRKTPLTILP